MQRICSTPPFNPLIAWRIVRGPHEQHMVHIVIGIFVEYNYSQIATSQLIRDITDPSFVLSFL